MELKAVADMVREAEKHADDQSHERIRATEYYQGVMRDTPPARQGRSAQTTRDVRSHVKKVLPSIIRTVLGADEVVEYQPVGEGDEQFAQQASDFVNHVIFPEVNGRKAIYDATHDALLLKNGILKWWWDEKQCVKISRHTGLTEQELAALVAEDDVSVIEQAEDVAQVEQMGPQGPVLIDVPVYDVKIRRAYTEGRVMVKAVPRERFLIHPDAITLEDSIVTGEKTEISRSDLIRMGYDRDLVDSLPLADEDEEERDARRDSVTDTDEADRANDPIDYYDLYIRVDMDGDGIAELRHMCFAGGLSERNLLENDECDEVQFADLCAMPQPHQWEGLSLADDLMDIQRLKTVLIRQTLDNLYWQNNLQPIVDPDRVEDMDAVLSPEFGKPIIVKGDVRQAYGISTVPFVAKESFGMLEYIDAEATDRTGISDASSGLAPDALQNMTAKASAMIEQAGIGQTEMMVRNIADGLRRFYRGLLSLIVRHQDKARTVRLRGEWVEFDPRHWNADMDAVVNVGLGAGTRERDMQVMQLVKQVQSELIAAFGPSNPYVTPTNLYNTLAKMVESAGLKTPSMYFTEPDEEEVKRRIAKEAEKPTPEQMKLQADMAREKMKQETQVMRERAQMEADLAVKRAEIEAETQRQKEELASRAALQAQEIAWEREKFAAQMENERRIAEMRRGDEIARYQAEQFNAAQNQRDDAA